MRQRCVAHFFILSDNQLKQIKIFGKPLRLSEICLYFCSQKLLKSKKMEATTTKPKNLIQSLLDCKRELRECIQNGADPEEMKRIARKYGFTFATPI